MKNIYSAVAVFLMLGSLHNNADAQLSVVNEGATYIVDFSTTIPGVNNGVWAGNNISSAPQSGELDRNAWYINNSLPGGSTATFGGSSISGGGGTSTGATGTGLFYAYQTGFGDPSFGVSPSSPAYTPGIITLKIVNNTGQTLKAFDVSFTDLARNSGNGMMSLNFWYSSSNAASSYTHLTDLDFVSPGMADNLWYSANQSTTITGLNVPNGSAFYLQWEINMSSGSGPDELSIDNISITGHAQPAVTGIPTVACVGTTINIVGANFFGATAVSVNGTDAPEFTINTTDSISVVVPSGATTGTISVTGPGGIGTSTSSIIVNPIPTDNAGVNRIICNGSGIIIGGANITGHTYNWSPATGLSSTKASNPTAAPTITTTYTLTETINATTCSSSNSVVVKVNPIPGNDAGANVTFCNGSTATIGKGSTAGRTYSWSPSNSLNSSTISNPVASPTVSTTYTLTETISSTTCFATNMVVVTVNPLPINITPTAPSAVCTGTSANISIAGSQVGVNYQLRNNTGNVNVGSPVAGTGTTINLPVGVLTVGATYNVLATNATTLCSVQMTGTVTIAVNPIPVAVVTNSSQVICSGTSFTTMMLGTSNAVTGTTFSWTRNNTTSVTGIAASATDTSITGVVLTNTTTSPVTVTFTITPIGPAPTSCAGSPVTATITVNPAPTGSANPQSVCSGVAVNIPLTSNISGTNFSWVASTLSGSVAGATSCASACGTTITQTLTSTTGGVEQYTVTVSTSLCGGQPFTVNVTVNALPINITPTGPATVCSGSAANISIAGSQVGVNYQLRNNAGNVNIGSPVAGTGGTINLPAGNLTSTTTFNVLASNTASCNIQMTGTVTITVLPVPVNNAGTNKTICAGAGTTIGLSGTAGDTYSWSPSASLNSSTVSNPTATPTITTTYTLTETITSSGCSAANSVQVTVNALPANDAGANRAICKGLPTTLGAASKTGETYSWSPATGLSSSTISNPATSPTATTTYTLTETSTATGCSASNNVVVTVNPLPANNTGGNKSICSGGNVVIGAASNPGEFYSWSPATGLSSSTVSNPTASPASTIIYSLKETSITGCSVSNTMVVTVNPSPGNNTGTNKAICNGANVIIGASTVTGHTYNWNPSTGLTSSTISNPTASPASTTTYTLTETLASTGCSASNSVVVTVNPLPSNNAGANQSICSGSGVAIGSSNISGDTYSWNPSASLNSSTISNPSASPKATTTYTLTETTTATGCSASNTVTVNVNALPGNDAGANATVCGGVSATIGAAATAGNTYSWSPATGLSSSTVSNPTASPAATTTYSLTETTAANCAVTDTVVVTINQLPNNITPTGTATICAGTATNISIAASQVGVNYQLINNTGNINVGSPVAGTGGTINLSSGNLNSTTTFNVLATNSTTSCNIQMTGTVTITVSPFPIATVTNGNQTICSGTSFTTKVLGTGNGVTGTTFTWTRDDTTNVTGIAASGSGSSITGVVLTNSTSSSSKVTFTIIPTGPTSCVGSPVTATVTVNPVPAGSAGAQAICSGTASNVALSSTVSGTTFIWSAANFVGIVSGASGCSSSCGTKIAQTLTSALGGVEKYTIIPVANSCVGLAFTANVTVFPVPAISASPATICYGSSTTLTASGVGSFTWSPATGLNVTTGASVIANPVSTITYTITAKNTSGCSSSLPVVVTVNQPPVAAAGTNQTTTQITANWAASAGATAYFLDVSAASDFSTFVFGFNNLNVGNVTAYIVGGLTPSTTYYYRVRTKNNICGTSVNSNTIIYSTACPSLAGVITSPDSSVICSGTTEILSLTGGVVAQTFQWQISSDNVNWSNVTTGGNSSTYSTMAADGTIKKYYRCLMTNSCYTAPSTTAVVNLSVVPTVTITAVTASTATVTWSPYGAGQFNISWSGAGSGSVNAVTTNSYTITSLISNQDLTVTVTPANPSCSGANAGTATTHTLCAIPTIASLTALAAPAHAFRVTWAAITGVSAYRVYYINTLVSGSWSYADTTGTGMTITVPSGGQTYGVYVAVKDCPSAGNIGQGSATSYVTTNPISGCTQVPVITSVSNCPNQITTNISGGSGTYILTLKRLSPGTPVTVSYPANSTLVNITVGALSTGSVWQVSAVSNCGSGSLSGNSNIVMVNVNPACPAVTNVVLKQPTCTGFTASWNVQDCLGSGVSNYELLIKKSGVLNYTSYSVGIVDHAIVSWLTSGATYNVAVVAVSCNGATSPVSLTDTITLAACRMEEPGEAATTLTTGDESVMLYPNPSGGQFNVDLGRTDMSEATVKIELLNQLGQVVQTNFGKISDGHFNQVINSPEGIATGLYFVRTTVTGGNVHINRLMITKE